MRELNGESRERRMFAKKNHLNLDCGVGGNSILGRKNLEGRPGRGDPIFDQPVVRLGGPEGSGWGEKRKGLEKACGNFGEGNNTGF